jgi:capsular exopolysaccharide synthesis family protein
MDASIESESPVIDLRAYLTLLRRRKWSVAVVAVLVTAMALILSARQTPIYRAETQVLVQPIDLTPATPIGLVNPNMDTEQRLARSTGVAQLAATTLGATGPPASLLRHLSVTAAMNTTVLQFKYSDPNPRRAQSGSQAFASAYVDSRKQGALSQLQALSQPLEQRLQDLRQQLAQITAQIKGTPVEDVAGRQALQTQANALVVQISAVQLRLSDLATPAALDVGHIVAPAQLPTSPSSPSYPKNIGLGIVLGVVLGLFVALIRERLDDHLRGPGDLQASGGVPVLGVVPQVRNWRRGSEPVLVSVTDPRSPSAEAYRTLRARVLLAMSVIGGKTLLVTSCHPGEGKTSTVANLGMTIARGGKKVIVVSADRRKPRVHAFFKGPAGPGLTEVLEGELSLVDVVVSTGLDNLRLLPSGHPSAPQDQIADAEGIARILQDLRHVADVVIVDATPLFGLADALALAPRVDTVLLVADAQRSTRQNIRQAREVLDQIGVSLLGTVLNNVRRIDAGGYGAYGYGYGYGYGGGDGSRRTRRREAEVVPVADHVRQSSSQ